MDAEKALEIVEVPISNADVEQLEHDGEDEDGEYDVQVSIPTVHLLSFNSHTVHAPSPSPRLIPPSHTSSPSGSLLPPSPIVQLTSTQSAPRRLLARLHRRRLQYLPRPQNRVYLWPPTLRCHIWVCNSQTALGHASRVPRVWGSVWPKGELHGPNWCVGHFTGLLSVNLICPTAATGTHRYRVLHNSNASPIASGGLGILFVRSISLSPSHSKSNGGDHHSAVPAMYRLGLLSDSPKKDAGKLILLTMSAGFFGIYFAGPSIRPSPFHQLTDP
jgi:hypothetical protein